MVRVVFKNLELPEYLKLRIAKSLVHFVIPVVFAAIFINTCVILFLVPSQYRGLLPQSVALVALVPAWILGRRGHFRKIAHILLLCFCLAVISGMVVNGGVRAPIYVAGTIALVGAFATIYGTRSGFLFVLTFLTIGLAFVVFDSYHLLPSYNIPSPLFLWFLSAVWLVLGLTFISVPIALMIEALRESDSRRMEVYHSRQAERESSLAFQAIFDQAFQSMVLLDPKGVILTANKAAVCFVGATLEEARGTYLYQGPWWTEEARNGLKRGIQLAARGELVGIQSQLHHIQKMESIGQVTGGIAHDFRNMLGAIVGSAELLSMEVEDPGQKKLVDLIIKSSARATDLTSKLLTFSRKEPTEKKLLSIHDILTDTHQFLYRVIDRLIEIQSHLNASMDQIIGDPSEWQNVFMNLGLNARDAMPDGGTLVFETHNIDLDKDFCSKSSFELKPGPHIKIKVVDTGTGISEETINKIFEPFFTTKSKGKGTGLGLAQVFSMVYSSHGAIDVQSQVSKGTTFNLTLPIRSNQVHPASQQPW